MTAKTAPPAVSVVMVPGEWRPTGLQELLVDAAVLDAERAEVAFTAWVAATGFDRVDAGSFRLLPLVAQRFESLGLDGPWSAHLRGVLRRSWVDNQVTLHATLPALDTLQSAGIEVVAFK